MQVSVIPQPRTSPSLPGVSQNKSDETSQEVRVPPPPPPLLLPPCRALVVPMPPPELVVRATAAAMRRRKSVHQQLGSMAPTSRDGAQRSIQTLQAQNLRDSIQNRAPGVHGEELAELGSSHVSTYRWSIATAGGGDGTLVRDDRVSVSVVRSFLDSRDSTWASVGSLAADTATLSLACSPDGSMFSRGGFAQLQPAHLTLGGSMAASLGMGWVVGGSLGWRFNGNGHLRLLEQRDGMVRLEQAYGTVRGVQMTGGAGVFIVGAGARMQTVWSRDTVLRLWQPAPEARALLLREDGSFRRHYVRKTEAFGWRAKTMPIPSLRWHKNDMELPIHGELHTTLRRNVTGGAACAFVGTLVGGYGATQVEMVLAVRRRTHHDVDLVFTWRHGRAATLGVEVPILAEFHNVLLGADTVCEGFTCDLRESAEVYHAMLEGKVPGHRLHLHRPTDTLEDLAESLRQEELPSGVHRLLAEALHVPYKHAVGGGMSLPWYIPFIKIPGLSCERVESGEQHTLVTPKESEYRQAWQVDHQTELPGRGVRTGSTFVSPEEVLLAPPFPQTRDQHLTVGMRFSYSHYAGHKTRGGLVDRINADVLGTHEVAYCIDPDKPCAYNLQVQRTLSVNDLGRLTEVHPPKRVSQSMGAEACRTLKQQLRLAGSMHARHEAVQQFVLHRPTLALGALHRWLDGDDERLRWNIQYTDVPDLVRQARELNVKFDAPPTTRRARKQVRAVYQGLQDAQVQVGYDPFLGLFDKPEKHEAELQQHLDRLAPLLES